MIGIPHCNRLEPKHSLTSIFFLLLDRFFQQLLGQSQFESHTAQRAFFLLPSSFRPPLQSTLLKNTSDPKTLQAGIIHFTIT